ncbi:hypothetical protein BDW74DRAFT_21128 [Aspergillus multicolor]|uniref:uncharacterized protein n=1 Tax=Aspergillus multicolor TaxID=41759 RepID=UPI003CCD010A
MWLGCLVSAVQFGSGTRNQNLEQEQSIVMRAWHATSECDASRDGTQPRIRPHQIDCGSRDLHVNCISGLGPFIEVISEDTKDPSELIINTVYVGLGTDIFLRLVLLSHSHLQTQVALSVCRSVDIRSVIE